MSNPVEKQQQEIEAIIKERIELTQIERSTIREELASIDNKIKTLTTQFTSANGQHRPRETLEEVNTTIARLEYSHATTSQTKAEEREFLRDLEKLRQKKKLIGLFTQFQNEVDELKARKNVVNTELKEKDEILEELHLGLRRVRTAMSLKVGINEVITETYSVPEDKLPMVIGKGGNNLRQIENEYGVSIETGKFGANELNILGTPAAIESALNAITTVINTTADEFVISEATISCLVFDKGALIQDIQTRYNVRMDVNRQKRSCKILGLINAVELSKHEIQSLRSLKQDIPIDVALLPYIVGKGGVTVRAIGEENHVHIDINREDSKITVMGLYDGVVKAVETIKLIADENKEVEEIIQVEKQIMIGCVIGAGGLTIRNIQTTFNVSLRTEKGTDFDILHIVGTTARVLAAKQHVLELISEYSKNSLLIEVPNDCMPILLGKKGSRINALREEHTTVNIDVENDSIRICGGTEETRNAAKAVIEDILASNWTTSMPCDLDLGILLKSTKGNDVRQQLISIYNLNVDIDTNTSSTVDNVTTINSTGTIKLRGYKQNVDKGLGLIQSFLSSFHTVILDLSDEDCASLMNGSPPGLGIGSSNSSTSLAAVATSESTAEPDTLEVSTPPPAVTVSVDQFIYSPTKYIETKYNVEVYINRKECKLRIRGTHDLVLAALAHFKGILAGNLQYGAVVIPIDPSLYATLIGKAGSNLKKMESELNVKFDILKSKSLLRIRGNVDQVVNAKATIIDFMDTVRATSTVAIPDAVSNSVSIIEKLVDICRTLYDCEFSINTTSKVVTIRGPLLHTEEAKIVLQELFQNKSRYSIKLPVQYTTTRRIEKAWKTIEKQLSISIELKVTEVSNEDSVKELILTGSFDGINTARKHVYDILLAYLPPSTFAVIRMSREQLKSFTLQKNIRDIRENPKTVYLQDLSVDRPLLVLTLSSSLPEAVLNTIEIVNQKLETFDKGHVSIPIESWMLPILVGKNGVAIVALEKSLGSGVSMNINRIGLSLDIECKDIQLLESAKAIVLDKLDHIRLGYFELQLDEFLVRVIIGKQGSTINKFRADLKANLDLDINTKILKITGTPEQVNEAKLKIQEFIDEERQKNLTKTIYVPAGLVPRLIGQKGANIREIQQSSGSKVDLDKENEIGTIRGSATAIAAAAKAIQDFFDKEGVEVNIEDVPDVPLKSVVTAPVVVPVADEKEDEEEVTPAIKSTSTLVYKSALSKSALKRLKKKEKQSDTIVTTSVGSGSIPASVPASVVSVVSNVYVPVPLDQLAKTIKPLIPVANSNACEYEEDDEVVTVPVPSFKPVLQTQTPVITAPNPTVSTLPSAPVPIAPMSYLPTTNSPAVVMPLAPSSVNVSTLPYRPVLTSSSTLPQSSRPLPNTSAFPAAAGIPGAPLVSSDTSTSSLLSILLGKPTGATAVNPVKSLPVFSSSASVAKSLPSNGSSTYTGVIGKSVHKAAVSSVSGLELGVSSVSINDFNSNTSKDSSFHVNSTTNSTVDPSPPPGIVPTHTPLTYAQLFRSSHSSG